MERLRIRYEAYDRVAKGHPKLRFDDSLDTVLTAEMSTPFGAQTAWRQLVDLIGRGRAPATETALARLRSIRPQVPASIRAASARALAFARPPAGLVRLFAEEDLPIAAPVLRMAELTDAEWMDIMPDMSPAGRSVLRHRRDLSGEVLRALESYGPSDFILPAEPAHGVALQVATELPPAVAEPEMDQGVEPVAPDNVERVEVHQVVLTSGPAHEPAHEVVSPAPLAVEADADERAFDQPLEDVAVADALPIEPLPAVWQPILEPLAELPATGLRSDGDDADEATLAEVALVPAEDDTIAVVAEPQAPWAAEALPNVAGLELDAEQIDAESEMALAEMAALPEIQPVEPPLAIDWTEVMRARPPAPPSLPSVEVPAVAPVEPVVNAAVLEVLPEPGPELVAAIDAPAAEEGAPAEPAHDELAAQSTASESSGFVSLASVAFGLPVVVAAMRQYQADEAAPVAAETEAAPAPDPVAEAVALAEVGPELLEDADATLTPDAVAEPVLPDAVLAEDVAPLLAPEPAVVAEEAAEPVAVVEFDPASPTAPDALSEAVAPAEAAPVARGPFQISDLVARIDAFNRQREEEARVDPSPMLPNDINRPLDPEGFRFETDAQGVIRWVAGVSRSAIVGMTLNQVATVSETGVDGSVAGAFRRRAGFANARMTVPGGSDAAGQWRISGLPSFDPASGRFTGYRGTARRPRKDECAEPGNGARSSATDSLRELVHELRTPTTAIAGFAEMIEGQLLGPVPNAYRDYAGTIREQARDLLGAIDDLDTAARIEAHALELRPGEVEVAPLFGRIAKDLEPLAKLRGAGLQVAGAQGVTVRGDDRAIERLVGRLMAALISATAAGEMLRITVAREGEETVAIGAVRPSGLAAYADDATSAIDAEIEAEADGAPLLGTGFALRLARNLASELGGSLSIGADRLTLRLPAAFTQSVDQASTL